MDATDLAGVVMRDTIVSLIRKLKTNEERDEAVMMALHISYEVARSIRGNAYMRGWAEAAIEDLDTDPPIVVVRELQ